MRCPSLNELPSPPPGKKGWPWTEESDQLSGTMRDGRAWPMISIVTPSYNQGQFLEETIRSVLLQGYPNLEYIIIDGNSADKSRDIIEKYKPWLSYWVSEPDRGQSEAINKGWHQSKGEVLAWINSDDLYETNAFGKVAHFISANPDVDMIYGDCNRIDKTGKNIKLAPAKEFSIELLVCNIWFIPQQSTFMRRKIYQKIGELDENLHLIMDWEYWLRIALNNFKIKFFPQILANFRIYENAKTSSQSEISGEEKIKVLKEIFGNKMYHSKIKPYKKRAYCYVHKWTGEAYYRHDHKLKALQNFLKSIRYGPYLLRNKTFRNIVFDCLHMNSQSKYEI